MAIVIGPATSAADLEALYQFRYRIYVEEMGRKQTYADHARKRIEDPLDATSNNLIARSGTVVVGCVRSNLSRDGGLDEYHNLLRMADVPPGDFPGRTSLCTRLSVDAAQRNSTLLARLFLANYEYGLSRNIRWTFLDCNDHLVGLFSRFGFVRTHGAEHPDYGKVNAMRLDLENAEHLKSVGSPFAAILARHMSSAAQKRDALDHAAP
jgi:N-acyl-L-homoserine lactone synthetase